MGPPRGGQQRIPGVPPGGRRRAKTAPPPPTTGCATPPGGVGRKRRRQIPPTRFPSVRSGFRMGVISVIKHLAAGPPGWYRFRDGGVATTISSRLFTTCFVRRSNTAQAPGYITVLAGLRGVPYNLLVETAILKQVCTSCFGLLKSSCTKPYSCISQDRPK